ncbi:hypothetical protein Indivirus_6_18 [Indivirus ILV1]|uniref:F-box domain-containing protein n=1 Tax=Indivirus ILV1 TaxID=1977633 RepID=A0A1V0SE24_9VIRU|nr:hypothetical protein Indivirus_6_18 [Indivirus ILV1]
MINQVIEESIEISEFSNHRLVRRLVFLMRLNRRQKKIQKRQKKNNKRKQRYKKMLRKRLQAERVKSQVKSQDEPQVKSQVKSQDESQDESQDDPQVESQNDKLATLLCGKSFPYFPRLLLLKYLPWKDFINLRLVCCQLYSIVDYSCDEKWMQFFQRTCSFLVPVKDEWNIFFPTTVPGCFRDLTLEVLKVLRLAVKPVLLKVPEIGNNHAEIINAYAFPWYFVCKFLKLPVASEICHDSTALRLTESYVRLDNSEIDEYSPLCVGEFLKKYAQKERMTISFMSRHNPCKVPEFEKTRLPIKRKNGPIAQLITDLPEMVTSFSSGRQLAFTLFVHHQTQTFDIWLSRLNANPDLVEQYQKQLSDYCSTVYGSK